MSNKINYTLKDVLTNYKIVIPSIQRDYAFGREGKKYEVKRESFIKVVTSAIKENEKVHLDFIYGKNTNSRFIPLDGQQRLTTLWLLELYVIKKEKKDLDNYEYLKNFSYETRVSSSEFCTSLIMYEWGEIKEIENLDKHIYEQKWFFNSWKNDPTIKSMCIVLNEIHKFLRPHDNFNEEKFNNLTFSFLNIEELGEPEDLYIKMNARGKELSPWDLFKSELIEILEENNSGDIRNSFAEWLDNGFLQYFWYLSEDVGDKKTNTENRMHHFIRIILFIELMEDSKRKIVMEDSEKESDKNRDDYVEEIMYNFKKIIQERSLKDIRTIINYLSENKEKIEKIKFKRFKNDGLLIFESVLAVLRYSKKDVNLGLVDKFYGYYKFITNVANRDWDEPKLIEELKQIIRITSNFSESYRNQMSSLKPYIIAMKEAIRDEEGILIFFAKDNLNNVSFGIQAEEQKKEEIVKAKLILNDKNWEEAIYKAESHEYFNGMVGYLLNASHLDLETFRKYVNKINECFDGEGIKNKKILANMFKYADIRLGTANLFPRNINSRESAANRERDYSWKTLFRKSGLVTTAVNQSEFKQNANALWVKKWLDDEEVETEKLEMWKRILITYPEIIDLEQGSIGGIRLLKGRFYGIKWKLRLFNGYKYDVPLIVLNILNRDVEYKGFRNLEEDNPDKYQAIYKKNIYIFYEYNDSKLTYIINKNGLLTRININSPEEIINIFATIDSL